MSDMRTWNVMANSSGNAELLLSGDSFEEALQASLERIAAEALPKGGRWRPVTANAEWQPGILRNKGGVEVTIDAELPKAAGGKTQTQFVVWIAASRADLPQPIFLTFAAATV